MAAFMGKDAEVNDARVSTVVHTGSLHSLASTCCRASRNQLQREQNEIATTVARRRGLSHETLWNKNKALVSRSRPGASQRVAF